ncbi:hypothetical protein niasHT_023305 [Heterodera trifolii]|uniref:Uncharacterized protein n=1 Tax=Heterodera trifolii TaxID=157864 RepID=A0ABD2JDU2_9BILA
MSFFDNPVVLNGGKAFFAFLMFFSNGLLVFVSFKAKDLNSTCNWLITANSTCIAIYSFTFFVQFGIVFLSPSGIPLWQCCLFVSVPLFFMCCQFVLFPLIAFDRLIGTIFPLNWVLNVCSIVLYIALWLRVKMMSSSDSEERSNETANRKILFSLIAIFLVETFGWVFNLSVKLLLIQLGATDNTKWYVMSYTDYLTQFALALNPPILYALSSVYRTAFQKVLGFGQVNLPTFTIQVVPMNGSGKTIAQK